MEHRRSVSGRVYVRGVRRAFLLTVLTCGMTCWLLYTSGCCLLEPSSPLAVPDDENTPAAAAAADGIDLAFRGTLEWENGGASNAGAHVRRLRADQDGLFILDKGRRRRRVQLHAYFAAAETATVSSADSSVVSSPSQVTPTKPWYRRNVTATRKHPQALIIGVKKGGTRALLEFIRLHPDVRAVGPETHFFDRHYDRGLDWYRRQMPPTLEGQMTMEKTPSYFITREVPIRIYNMSRDTRLLVVVRDPVTRAISDYAQTASKRRDMRSFEELTFLNASSGLVDTTWSAIKIGVYAKHLDRWLQFFPLKHFHFVSGENLIKDPAGEMAKVQDFLGLRRVITENHFYFNETKGFPCLKKSEGNGSPRCLGKTKGRVHPSIDSATIQRLRDFYRPFNLKFYQMTNIDFGWP